VSRVWEWEHHNPTQSPEVKTRSTHNHQGGRCLKERRLIPLTGEQVLAAVVFLPGRLGGTRKEGEYRHQIGGAVAHQDYCRYPIGTRQL